MKCNDIKFENESDVTNRSDVDVVCLEMFVALSAKQQTILSGPH